MLLYTRVTEGNPQPDYGVFFQLQSHPASFTLTTTMSETWLPSEPSGTPTPPIIPPQPAQPATPLTPTPSQPVSRENLDRGLAMLFPAVSKILKAIVRVFTEILGMIVK
jgi:hypothetical protein